MPFHRWVIYAIRGDPPRQPGQQVFRGHGRHFVPGFHRGAADMGQQNDIGQFAETRRQLGQGTELERVLFVGGGTVALAEHVIDWFPNQLIVPQAAFANARGMLKYGRYVAGDDASE